MRDFKKKNKFFGFFSISYGVFFCCVKGRYLVFKIEVNVLRIKGF